MSEETLRRFLERLSEDTAFRDSAVADPESAFAAFGLSPAEQVALAAGDEDALRRLAGADVEGFRINDPPMTRLCPGPNPMTRLAICPESLPYITCTAPDPTASRRA